MELKNNINIFISGLSVVEKIIFLNVVIYIVPFFINTVLFLFNINNLDLLNWFTIDADLSQLIFKPWSFITYGFLHGSFSHIFWNMIILYYFGKILNNLFGDKHFKNLYLSGIAAGGVTYVISYNIFPAFKGVDSVMIGASAGVMSVLFYLAFYNPQRIIRIFFFDIKIIYIALFLFLYDVIQIPLNNSGGHIAHLGGAMWGYYYCNRYNKGHDLVKSFFKNFKKNKSSNRNDIINNSNFDQKRIDSILDKISDSGYDSLTKYEKDYLFKVGKNKDK
tara:strand:- start:343 stop:1173 length:831 start_codon:yes stop_codon:yes gene_type:complete